MHAMTGELDAESWRRDSWSTGHIQEDKGHVSRQCVLHRSSIRAQRQVQCLLFLFVSGLFEPLISD